MRKNVAIIITTKNSINTLNLLFLLKNMNEPTINNINLHEITQEIAKKKESKSEIQNFSDKEALKRLIKEKHEDLKVSDEDSEDIKKSDNQKIEDEGKEVPPSDLIPDYANEISEESRIKVENLIKTTLESGLSQGLKQAKKEEPYIIDLYHDALVDKLLDELKEKNLL